MNRRIFALLAISSTILGTPACGGSTPPAAEASAGRGPSDVYTAYVAAIGNAGAIKEVHPFLSAAGRKRVADLETLKAKAPGGVLKIDAEKIDGARATLTVLATIQSKAGKEQPATGTVVLVREDGGWKVDQESWEVK